jgi:IS1 family transposase
MNKLSPEERARILHLLCEGQSIRATVRLTGASKNTISKLLVTAGKACMAYQDRTLVNLQGRKWQVDELWSFVGAREKNVPVEKQGGEMGDIWTWVALDTESKLVGAWYIGDRDAEAAMFFMDNLAKRLANRVQLTSDGHGAYLGAVDTAFTDIDYGMLVKIYGASKDGKRHDECIGARKAKVFGNPDPKHISTYVERHNGIIRQHCRRYARLTLAFSKKLDNHMHAFALHTMYHNFVKITRPHRMTPAMAAGVESRLWEMSDIVKVIEDWEASEGAAK